MTNVERVLNGNHTDSEDYADLAAIRERECPACHGTGESNRPEHFSVVMACGECLGTAEEAARG